MTKRSIDWNEVRERLKNAQSSIEQGWVPGPEQARDILRERARLLAEQPKRTTAGEHSRLVQFLLGNERYAVDAELVREVHALTDLTRVPCTPAFVAGIFNLRGQIVSVIDLKKFFDLPGRGLGDLNKVIVLRSDSMQFGLLADAILDVRDVPIHELQPPPPTLTGVRQDYLKGIAADGTIVLDGVRLLSDTKLIVHEKNG